MRVRKLLPLLAMTLLLAGNASAAGLPKTMVWMSQDTTSAAYAQAVAIGKMLKKSHGTSVRVLRERDPAARMMRLRTGDAAFCLCGSEAYFAQEGMFRFASAEQGPQPLRIVAAARNAYNLALATAADASIDVPADLKGKRISWLKGRNEVNWSTAAFLAFAGLSWRDVKAVEVDGFRTSLDAVADGLADAALVATFSPYVQKLRNSTRGLSWLQLPHADAEGWRRLKNSYPLARKNVVRKGFGVDSERGLEGFSHDYPLLITSAETSDETVYLVLKAMMERFDSYRQKAPGAQGWTPDGQSLRQAWPMHSGAIRYWRERKRWSDGDETHQNRQLQRQQTLQSAWRAHRGKTGGDQATWAEVRHDALAAAGFEPVFDKIGLR